MSHFPCPRRKLLHGLGAVAVACAGACEETPAGPDAPLTIGEAEALFEAMQSTVDPNVPSLLARISFWREKLRRWISTCSR